MLEEINRTARELEQEEAELRHVRDMNDREETIQIGPPPRRSTVNPRIPTHPGPGAAAPALTPAAIVPAAAPVPTAPPPAAPAPQPAAPAPPATSPAPPSTAPNVP
jgi:hypothetical protein